jgi:hypothetical protein
MRISTPPSIFCKKSLIYNHEMKNALSASVFSLYCLISSSVVHADKAIPATTTHDRELLTAKKDLKSNYFVHKSVIIPHDEKKYRGGEDAASTSDQWLVGE